MLIDGRRRRRHRAATAIVKRLEMESSTLARDPSLAAALCGSGAPRCNVRADLLSKLICSLRAAIVRIIFFKFDAVTVEIVSDTRFTL